MRVVNAVSLTPPAGDSTDRVATTQFVQSAVTSGTLNVLTTNGGEVITGGFTWTPFALGTVTTGTITPTPANNLKQTLINGGTFTVAATTAIGDIEIYVTNTASAGIPTFSGFTKQFTGDAYDTTSGHEFVVYIYGFANASGSSRAAYLIKAMQ